MVLHDWDIDEGASIWVPQEDVDALLKDGWADGLGGGVLSGWWAEWTAACPVGRDVVAATEALWRHPRLLAEVACGIADADGTAAIRRVFGAAALEGPV